MAISIDSYQARDEKDQPNGYAGLDGSADVPAGSLGTHAANHEDTGPDEINVDGLSGDLADLQDPKLHATTHQHAGSDEVATATPAANAIPKAGAGATLAAGWLPPATESARGALEIATQVETDAGTDDTRAVTPLKLAGNFLSENHVIALRVFG